MELALLHYLKSKQQKDNRSKKQYKFAVAQDSKEGKAYLTK
jgi:hypothetical protein